MADRRDKAQGYQVRLVIERFSYNKKIGSHTREVIDRPVTLHNNWSLGDYETAQEADNAVAALVHIDPPHCTCKG